jgi:hypothetical protein
MCQFSSFYSQIIQNDTIKIAESAVEEKVFYKAKDSIVADYKNKRIHLYGDAEVYNSELTVNACYILFDLELNEIYATYCYDNDSLKTGLPTFKDEGEEITASSIR